MLDFITFFVGLYCSIFNVKTYYIYNQPNVREPSGTAVVLLAVSTLIACGCWAYLFAF